MSAKMQRQQLCRIVTLISNALDCRYRFWADYEGEGDEGFGVAGSPGSGGKHRRRSKKGFAPEASPGREDGEPPPREAQRHDGGGGVHHRPHHPVSARRGGPAVAGGGPTGNTRAHGQQQPPSEAVSGAVQRALAGVGNNVTAPAMVRQVDRADMYTTVGIMYAYSPYFPLNVACHQNGV